MTCRLSHKINFQHTHTPRDNDFRSNTFLSTRSKNSTMIFTMNSVILFLSITPFASARPSLLRMNLTSNTPKHQPTMAFGRSTYHRNDASAAMRELAGSFGEMRVNLSLSMQVPGTEMIMSMPPLDIGCQTAYAYCPGRSTCFIPDDTRRLMGGNGMNNGGGPWGWNIDLEGLDLAGGDTLACPVYAGAGQCDFENREHTVGELLISYTSVDWYFGLEYGGSDFHLYAGKCPYNDKGLHLTDGTCDNGNMDNFKRSPGQYSLGVETADGDLFSSFGFNDDNDEGSFRSKIWATESYVAFPLVPTARQYLSAHAKVCSCGSPGTIVGDCDTTEPPLGLPLLPPVVEDEDSSAPSPATSSSFAPSSSPTTLEETPDSGTPPIEGNGASTSSSGVSPGQTALIALVVGAALVVGLFVARRSGSSSSSVSSSSDGSSGTNSLA